MGKASQRAGKKDCPIGRSGASEMRGRLDRAPGSLAAAARTDLRNGRRAWPGVQEAIAERFGIAPESVYKITASEERTISLAMLEAIVETTGGAEVRGYLDHLAAPRTRERDCVQMAAADLVARAAELNRIVAEAFLDGVVSEHERDDIERVANHVQGTVARLRGNLR